MHLLTLWYVILVCYQNSVYKNYIESVYVGGYGSLGESGLCVFRKLCTVSFHVVGKSTSVLLQFIIMLYVDSGDNGYMV